MNSHCRSLYKCCLVAFPVHQSINANLCTLVDYWTIVFCPSFFTNQKLKYLEERSAKPEVASNIYNLDAYERVIAHEIMHAGIVGYSDASKQP